MTPVEISTLIHFYYRSEPHPQLETPAVRSAIQYFLKEGVIEYDPSIDTYRTTDRGKAWVEKLKAVEIPELTAAQKLEMTRRALLDCVNAFNGCFITKTLPSSEFMMKVSETLEKTKDHK